MSWTFWDAVTEYYRLGGCGGGLNNTYLIVTVLEAGGPRSRHQQILVSSEGLLSG